MSESITGYIDHIIFRNEDNGYTVMVLKGVSEEDELTCVGSFPVVTQGASVELEGNFTQHPVYGKQFQAVRLTEKMPEDALAMERYLGSGARDCHADRGKVRYAEGNDVFAEIWDFTEPWCQNLPEVWRLCLQCFAGKPV